MLEDTITAALFVESGVSFLAGCAASAESYIPMRTSASSSEEPQGH